MLSKWILLRKSNMQSHDVMTSAPQVSLSSVPAHALQSSVHHPVYCTPSCDAVPGACQRKHLTQFEHCKQMSLVNTCGHLFSLEQLKTCSQQTANRCQWPKPSVSGSSAQQYPHTMYMLNLMSTATDQCGSHTPLACIAHQLSRG